MARYYSISEVVAEAMTITPGVNDADENIGRQWVASALNAFGTSEDEIQVCEDVPKNLLVKKPDNMRTFIELALYDSTGCWLPHRFHGGGKRIYPQTEYYFPRVTTNSVAVGYASPIDVSENQFSFILGTNGTDVALMKMRYFAYPLDEEGMPMIREDEKEACILYIRRNKLMKEGANQAAIQIADGMWKQAADIARAAKKHSSMNNDKAKVIARSLNRMIPNFNRSQF